MVMFSKFVSSEYTKFLFCLTVLLLFASGCFAENIQTKTERVVSERVVSGTNENTGNENEKKFTLETAAVPEKKAVSVSKNLAPENVVSKSVASKNVTSEEGIPERPKSENSKESTPKNVISEFIETISSAKIAGIKKPFKDLPGYWKEPGDFDVTITNAEANDEFPSEKFSLRSLKGNVVILFFTTTWCPNCIKVFQDLDNLSQTLLKKNISNVKIIPLVLGMEDDETVKNYYKENQIVSLRRFKALSPLFFNVIRAVPTCFVFNKKAVLVWGFSGATNYGAFEFLDFIESLSKED